MIEIRLHRRIQPPTLLEVGPLNQKYGELSSLLANALEEICQSQPAHLYNLDTHFYLMRKGWEIMFPLKKEEWPKEFNEFLVEKNLPWPDGSTYACTMGVVAGPGIDSSCLRFGYAVVAGKLQRCAFFAVEKDCGDYDLRSVVIDPLAWSRRVEPDYYIGCEAPPADISRFLTDRRDPLEAYVMRMRAIEDEEICRREGFQAYNRQLIENPNNFPEELIRFARENRLEIPRQGALSA